MGCGNRRRGIKKRRAALAGIGQVPVQHGLRKHRTSLAVNGVDAFRAKLLHHVHANLPEQHTLKLIDKIIRLVLCRKSRSHSVARCAAPREVILRVDDVFQAHDGVSGRLTDGRNFESLICALNSGHITPLTAAFLKT